MGQEPPTVRTRLGVQGPGCRRELGCSWSAPARPAHCAEPQPGLGPLGTCRGSPPGRPRGTSLPQGCAHQELRHSASDTAQLAGCPLLGACRSTPCPPDGISRNITLQSGEYLTQMPWLSHGGPGLAVPRTGHPQVAARAHLPTPARCVSHDLGHPPAWHTLPSAAAGREAEGKGTEGRTVGRDTEATASNKPKEGWEREPSAATKKRIRSSSTRTTHESNM